MAYFLAIITIKTQTEHGRSSPYVMLAAAPAYYIRSKENALTGSWLLLPLLGVGCCIGGGWCELHHASYTQMTPVPSLTKTTAFSTVRALLALRLRVAEGHTALEDAVIGNQHLRDSEAVAFRNVLDKLKERKGKHMRSRDFCTRCTHADSYFCKHEVQGITP